LGLALVLVLAGLSPAGLLAGFVFGTILGSIVEILIHDKDDKDEEHE